jgi:hypothetical protein
LPLRQRLAFRANRLPLRPNIIAEAASPIPFTSIGLITIVVITSRPQTEDTSPFTRITS